MISGVVGSVVSQTGLLAVSATVASGVSQIGRLAISAAVACRAALHHGPPGCRWWRGATATMTTGRILNGRRAVRAGFSTDFLSAGDGFSTDFLGTSGGSILPVNRQVFHREPASRGILCTPNRRQRPTEITSTTCHAMSMLGAFKPSNATTRQLHLYRLRMLKRRIFPPMQDQIYQRDPQPLGPHVCRIDIPSNSKSFPMQTCGMRL